MILIYGTFRIDLDIEGEVRAMMDQVITKSRAEKGCVQYAYAEDVIDPGLFRVTEQWESREALASHFESEHMRQWMQLRERHGFRDRDLYLAETPTSERL